MEYERYKKYFLARKFWFRYVGIALVGLGAAMFIIGYFSHAFFILPAQLFLQEQKKAAEHPTKITINPFNQLLICYVCGDAAFG